MNYPWNATNLSYATWAALNNGSYLNVPETDPRWTANFTNMRNPCSPNFVTGIHPNGTFICGTFTQAAETDPYWGANYSIFLTHATTSYVDTQNLSMRHFVNYANNTMKDYVDARVASIGEPNWNANYSNVAFTNLHETFNQNVTFLRNISVDGSTLVVDSNNNRVGVNTVAPSQTLEVAGTFRASSSQSSITLDSNGNVLIGI